MGRAAHFTKGCGLPPAAREEAEQREHENDDQDDPENAQCSHLLRASSSHYNGFSPPKVSQAAGVAKWGERVGVTTPRRFSSLVAGQRQAMPRAIWSGS